MSTGGRRGRRPGDPAVTRQAILEAARTAFAGSGYERVTIRAIAGEAGVDPALIHHYFGSKQELFVTAHGLPVSPALVKTAIHGTGGTRGERLARAYLSASLTGEGRFEALIRSAMSNPTARDMLRDFVEGEILDAFEDEIDGPDARMRIALAGSHLMGLFMMRRIIGIDAVRDPDLEDLVAAVAPAIDRYLDPPGLRGTAA